MGLLATNRFWRVVKPNEYRKVILPLTVLRQGQDYVVTSSRLHAVRYMKAFERYITANGYQDVRTINF
jgi:hypothetical protein